MTYAEGRGYQLKVWNLGRQRDAAGLAGGTPALRYCGFAAGAKRRVRRGVDATAGRNAVQRPERWRPRRLAWLRLAASRACRASCLITAGRSVALRAYNRGATQQRYPPGAAGFATLAVVIADSSVSISSFCDPRAIVTCFGGYDGGSYVTTTSPTFARDKPATP